LVSHAEYKEVDTRAGKRTRIFPTLPGKSRDAVVNMADVILFADLIDTQGPDGKPVTERVLRCSPTAEYEAGDRTKHLPDTLPLEYSAVAGAFAAGGVTMNPGSPQDLVDEIIAKMDAAVAAGGIAGLGVLWKAEARNWKADYPTGVGAELFADQIEPYKAQLKAATNGEKPEPDPPAGPSPMADQAEDDPSFESGAPPEVDQNGQATIPPAKSKQPKDKPKSQRKTAADLAREQVERMDNAGA
jgi:hypothetical protein